MLKRPYSSNVAWKITGEAVVVWKESTVVRVRVQLLVLSLGSNGAVKRLPSCRVCNILKFPTSDGSVPSKWLSPVDQSNVL